MPNEQEYRKLLLKYCILEYQYLDSERKIKMGLDIYLLIDEIDTNQGALN